MEDIDNVQEFTQCDDIHNLVPGQTSPVILESPTSEMIEEISAYFEASQGMLGNSSEASLFTAAESESIERPVITKVPVSRAHRYRRSGRSDATAASEESGGESASSDNQPVRSSARCKNVKGRKKWAFQAFRSPFLEGNSFNTTLPLLKRSIFSTIQQEAKLKTYAVGGFLKCIRLWHRVNKEQYVQASSLPAVYMDADETLSPLSEGNETSDEDGIKVVGNDFFVKSTKGQCPRRQGSVPSSSQTKNHIHANTVTQTKRSKTVKRVRGRGSLPVDKTESLSKNGRTSNRAKGVRGCCTRPVDETLSHDKNRPSSPPHPGPPEEEGSIASTQPEDHLIIESTGDSAILEESSGLVLQKDPSSDVARVQQVTPPLEMLCTGDNISAGNRQPDVVKESVCRSPDLSKTKTKRNSNSKKVICKVVVELAPGVPDKHENNGDEQQRKRRKRGKKELKVTEEEEINISLDGPCPALGTPDASQPTSDSTMINNDQSLNPSVDQLEDLWKPRKKSKKKKPRTNGVVTEGEVNVLDTFSTHETSTLNETTTVGFIKRKRKKDKMAPCSEDPETNPEAETTEGVNPFKHPADQEVTLEEDALETSDVSQKTLGSAMSITFNNDDVDVEHARRKNKKKEKKRKVAEEEEINMSLDGPCPALETSDISQSGSAMTVINNNDDDEHRKRKRRKKGNKLKVSSGEEINMSLDGSCLAVETSDVSQRTSESINNDHSLDGSVDQLEDLWKPRKKSKKKKSRANGVVTEEEVNVVDTVSTHETSTLTETTAGFKKWKSKKDKMGHCPEDPQTNPEADNTESEQSPFKQPAGREVECQRKKRRKQKMSETTQYAICEDTLVEVSGLTSVREKKRKLRHSFLSDDTVENHPKPNRSVTGFDNRGQNHKSTDEHISTCDVDTEPVENSETPVDSLMGPSEIVKTKKKKKRARDASRVYEACEGSLLDVRSSAEPGDDIVRRKKKKKKKDKADRESESPVVVERETPDDIETAVLMKKYKCKKNTRPPSQGSTLTKACVESGVTTPTDSVTISPRRCLPVVDADATQGGNAAILNDDSTVKKKMGKKREKNTSVSGTCDSVPEPAIRTTTEPLQHWTTETELCLKKKKKKKKDRRVMDRIETATDPGVIEAQHSSHEAEVTSHNPAPLESRTQMHYESSYSRRNKKCYL
ncbi:unnamed protein product [Lota lota]